MDTATQMGSREISSPAQRRRFSMVSSKMPATTSMFCPRLARISLAFSGVLSKGTSWNLIPGQSSWSFGHRSTSTWAGVMGEVPMRMMSSLCFMAFLALVTESLQYWMIYLASCARDFPASVSCRPRWVRTKSCKSRFSSSKLICLITAGGEIYSFSAALLKLPHSTTHRKVSNCGLYIKLSTPLTGQTLLFPFSVCLLAFLHL